MYLRYSLSSPKNTQSRLNLKGFVKNMYYCQKNTTMTVTIKPNATKAEIEAELKKLKVKTKRFDAYKFAGKVQWGQDGLEYQRELRAD
jgi:uncharacterized protein (DUF934 family)